MAIIDTEFFIDTLGIHKKNYIKVADVSNIGAITSVNTRGQAGCGVKSRVPDLQGKVRQVSINGEMEWLTAIEYLIEYRNARVGEGVVVIRITARAIMSSARGTIGLPIVRRAIGSVIIVGIISMPAIIVGIIATPGIIVTSMDRTKISLNFVELIHVSLTGD